MNPRASLRTALLLAAGASCAFVTSDAAAQTYESSLSFISEPGDPVGLGQSITMSPVRATGGEFTIEVYGKGTDGDYYLSLSAPDGQPLLPGVYEDAHGGEVAYDPARPRLMFQYETPRCPAVNGRFEITDIEVEPSGYVERLSANFEQRCEGSSATLWGQVDIHQPPIEPLTRFDVEVARVVELVRGEHYDEVFGYFTATCNSATGGTYGAKLEQKGPRGTVASGTASDRFQCGPEAVPQRLDFSPTGFKPGPAVLTVDAFVVDPTLGEEGPYFTRVVSRRVLLRPTRH